MDRPASAGAALSSISAPTTSQNTNDGFLLDILNYFPNQSIGGSESGGPNSSFGFTQQTPGNSSNQPRQLQQQQRLTDYDAQQQQQSQQQQQQQQQQQLSNPMDFLMSSYNINEGSKAMETTFSNTAAGDNTIHTPAPLHAAAAAGRSSTLMLQGEISQATLHPSTTSVPQGSAVNSTPGQVPLSLTPRQGNTVSNRTERGVFPYSHNFSYETTASTPAASLTALQQGTMRVSPFRNKDQSAIIKSPAASPIAAAAAAAAVHRAETEDRTTAEKAHRPIRRRRSSTSDLQTGDDTAVGDDAGDGNEEEVQTIARSRSSLSLSGKSYNCDLCNLGFRRSHDLKRHIRSVHTKVKPFQCPKCNKAFSRTDALKRHVSRAGSLCYSTKIGAKIDRFMYVAKPSSPGVLSSNGTTGSVSGPQSSSPAAAAAAAAAASASSMRNAQHLGGREYASGPSTPFANSDGNYLTLFTATAENGGLDSRNKPQGMVQGMQFVRPLGVRQQAGTTPHSAVNSGLSSSSLLQHPLFPHAIPAQLRQQQQQQQHESVVRGRDLLRRPSDGRRAQSAIDLQRSPAAAAAAAAAATFSTDRNGFNFTQGNVGPTAPFGNAQPTFVMQSQKSLQSQQAKDFSFMSLSGFGSGDYLPGYFGMNTATPFQQGQQPQGGQSNMQQDIQSTQSSTPSLASSVRLQQQRINTYPMSHQEQQEHSSLSPTDVEQRQQFSPLLSPPSGFFASLALSPNHSGIHGQQQQIPSHPSPLSPTMSPTLGSSLDQHHAKINAKHQLQQQQQQQQQQQSQ